jgi:1A family penicillin-binding protein
MPVAHLLQGLSLVAFQIPPSWQPRVDQLKRDWERARREHPRIVIGVASSVTALFLIALFSGVWFFADLRDGLPDDAAIQKIGDMQQTTAVFDADDRLAFTIFEEQRLGVPLQQISPNLVRALIATEDQRFYDHHGFDVVRIMSAAAKNVRHGRVVQGGSTITQQLARQSFLKPEKTFRRKLQELILAARIEGQYSKQRILELYLNKVYFGDGLYGAEAAARGYFGKHASELDVPEAALLAGLVKSPSTYAPTASLARAKARRNVVLQAMLDNGVIDRATWETARPSKIALHDTLRASDPHGQYFKEQVRRELVDRFGWQRVYQGGLRVYSTIDMPTQIAAEQAVADQIGVIEERRKKYKKLRGSDPLQAALVSIDPGTGHVRAMVGGRDFDQSRFNRAVQAHRQPGSAFKPFVYATALEAGYTPASVIDRLNEPIATVQGGWTPEDEHSTGDSMTMRAALRASSNRAAVRMLQDVGIARTVAYAKQMGVGDVPSVPSLALGSGEVTVESMTAAYAAFANHGLVPKPVMIRRVEDQDGSILYENHDSSTQAISDVTAFLMSSMLADVINAGTAAGARRIGFTLPAAGKTGTTNDFNDAWFIGYTPHVVTGVWVGFDQPHTILPRGFAADIAVPLWAKFMKTATKNDKPDWLIAPPGVSTATVCRISGKLATEGCEDVEVVGKDDQVQHRSMVYTEYFARGTEPTTYCDQHPTLGIMSRIANALGVQTAPSPPQVDESAPPPPPVATSGDVEIAPGPPEKKKRGFWFRLFGAGRDDKDEPGPGGTQPKKKPQ